MYAKFIFIGKYIQFEVENQSLRKVFAYFIMNQLKILALYK